MAEYIERESAIKALTLHDCDSAGSKMAICDLPAADVAPVRHGCWLANSDGTHFCSECGRDALHYQFDKLCFREELSDFCHNCGAKMDLKEERDA